MALEPHTPSSHPLSELLARLPGKSNQYAPQKKKREGQPHEVADSAQQTGAQHGIGTRAEADRPTACHATCTGTGIGTSINTGRPQIHL